MEHIIQKLDISYSYQFAKKLETYRCNEILGYRTAGSAAELATGDMIYEEMLRIGLHLVTKDRITLDTWEFDHARLCFQMPDGRRTHYQFELGGYQTDFHTQGPKEYELIYLNKGTANDYEGVDAAGKLVLADINQRDEWWIGYPVYQAHIKGAAALLAVQQGGYGEVHKTALNAQDIGGPPTAPAFSISQADAEILKQAISCTKTKSLKVILDAESTVERNGYSYNILGELPGQDPNQAILLSAHYDSYFSGFQDDNAAVGMMLGIAKAFIESGYQPQKTLRFCAMAAEEWGITNSKYDWSTGAYQEVFYVRTEWKGRVMANLNFELPAYAHGAKDEIRCVYEYVTFLKSFARRIPKEKIPYPDGLSVVTPVLTWSDDFSIAISGIPSMVNDFSSSSFMETHYHSQFDNETYYDEEVYRFHHTLYALLTREFDRTVLPPLDFSVLFWEMEKNLQRARCDFEPTVKTAKEKLKNLLDTAAELGESIYHRIQKLNGWYGELLNWNEHELAEKYRLQSLGIARTLLNLFSNLQDSFVRIDWYDDVCFPHEIVVLRLHFIEIAICQLKEGDVTGALNAIYEIDNARYAFQFEKEVFDYFTDLVYAQPEERLQWGAGRMLPYESLYELVQTLMKKRRQKEKTYTRELSKLKAVQKKQNLLLLSVLEEESTAVTKAIQRMKEIQNSLERNYDN